MAYRRSSASNHTSMREENAKLRGVTATLTSIHCETIQGGEDGPNSVYSSGTTTMSSSSSSTATNLKRSSKKPDDNNDNNSFTKLLCFLLNFKLWEIIILTLVAVFFCCVYYYHDALHFHILRTYAWAGYDEAQQLVGQRYAMGKGVEQHTKKAMEYFRMAAEQGHPKASHNLALGHVMRHVKLEPGEARRLLNHASEHGVSEADVVLDLYCNKKSVCND